MFQNFRLAMAWVHTWFGLVLGFVLMAAFFFGALSVFAREIDRWAVPETRFDPQPLPSFEQTLGPAFEAMRPAGAGAVEYWQVFRTLEDSALNLYAGYLAPEAAGSGEPIYAHRIIDPRTGEAMPAGRLEVGMGFFYPMHFNLTLHWKDIGAWTVALAALSMLAALASGVVMHRKLFREFFTFRPHKGRQRSTLDLHNLTGVVALPFHFFFAYTGLVIFAGIYFPVMDTQLQPLHALHEQREAQQSPLPQQRAGVAAPLAPVDAMVAEAQHRWAARGTPGEVGNLLLVHVGDANGYVSILRAPEDRLTLHADGIHFRAATGEVLHEDVPTGAAGRFAEFLTGLHLMPFRHWLLRWLYFLGGIAGCACIATGFLFFVEKRRRQHAKQGSQGARVVEAMAVTTVTGMLLATLALLIANRLLPAELPAGWPARAGLERHVFWLAWLLALAHAFWRGAEAWRGQCRAIAAMAVGAALANWLTTGDHLLRTLREPYWPVAGVDLMLLASAAVAAMAARRLGRMPMRLPGQA